MKMTEKMFAEVENAEFLKSLTVILPKNPEKCLEVLINKKGEHTSKRNSLEEMHFDSRCCTRHVDERK